MISVEVQLEGDQADVRVVAPQPGNRRDFIEPRRVRVLTSASGRERLREFDRLEPVSGSEFWLCPEYVDAIRGDLNERLRRLGLG